jgi:hypothetical protein
MRCGWDTKQAPAAQCIAKDHDERLDELERLLNDPGIPVEPDRVWSLVFGIARHQREVQAV